MCKEKDKLVEHTLDLMAKKMLTAVFDGEKNPCYILLESVINMLIGCATDEQLKKLSEDAFFKTISPEIAYEQLVKRREKYC
ncbi:MAG: hypothetical protein L3J07_04240 [Candidatus Magasanikbacteria bacterium]|nr:hypothetical protein [Candidatus Magasanikbacteria bacterium]